MAFAPGFEFDYFISYAHVDNHFKWVDHFHQNLIKILQQHNKHADFNGFLDHQNLRRNERFDERLKQGVQDSAFLIIMMSQAYLDAEYCRLEREWFIESVGGIKAAQDRWFVVRLSDLDPSNDWPLDLRKNIGDPFFDGSGNAVAPISMNFEKEGRAPRVFLELARELYDGLSNCGSTPSNAATPTVAEVDKTLDQSTEAETLGDTRDQETQQPDTPTVFLAEVHDSLTNDRNELFSYLTEAGFNVIPDSSAHRFMRAQAEIELPTLLNQSTVVVQLHHDSPMPSHGYNPDGFEHWFNEQVAAAGKAPGQNWLRWRSPDLQEDSVADETHRNLIFDGNVIREDLASFRQLVQRQTAAIHEQQNTATADGQRQLLIKTKRSTEDIAEELGSDIEDIVEDEQLDNLESAIVDETAVINNVVKKLASNAQSATGFALVYGGDDDPWFEDQVGECRRIALSTPRDQRPAFRIYVQREGPRPKIRPTKFQLIEQGDDKKLRDFVRKAANTNRKT